MPPVWRDRLARMRQTVDGKFADACRFVPIATSQYGGVMNDPNRGAFLGAGLLTVGAGETANPAGSRESSWSARLAVGKAELKVDVSIYPECLILRKGDEIHSLDRNEIFEINRIDHGQRSRVCFELTRRT